MILIADSGSTKTNWSLCSSDASVQKCSTGGINPYFTKKEDIISLLRKEFLLKTSAISSIYFYGAGCTPSQSSVVVEALQIYFGKDCISVESDLLAAVRSLCRKEEGIVGILGTGSNSCYYDGERIAYHVSPLGYILGDEGSGAVMGKKLIADILKNQLPGHIIQAFFEKYKLTHTEILDKVYRDAFPNRYLAQFIPFLKEHMDEEPIVWLVEKSMEEFVVRNLFQYKKIRNMPVHFTGSIAYQFRDNLKNVMRKHQLITGRIEADPMPGLIQYHIKYG